MNNSTGFPRERLAQIASRRLAALQLPHQVLPDRATVEGVFAFTPGRVVNPVTGIPVGRVRFAVMGHDHLKFADAPLSALPPVPFYDARSVVEVESQVVQALQTRAEVLKTLAARFEALKLKPQLDPDALVVRGVVDTQECRFEMEGGVSGVRVRALAEPGRPPVALPEDAAPLNLDDFPAGVDLELHLCDRMAELRALAARGAQRVSADAGSVRGPVSVEPAPLPVGTLTLEQLVHGFGPGVVMVPGQKLEVAQDFLAGGLRYRFVAQQEAGQTFRARLTGPKGVHWQDRIDLGRFPGMLAFVASVLGVPVRGAEAASAMQQPPQHASPEPAWATGRPQSTPSVMIHPGEVWVMAVIVEQQTGEEVRYACIDVNGHPYGAPRILNRADFERVFVPHGAGWRLLIRIERVEGEVAYYRQLNAAREAGPGERNLHLSVLTTTFVPEAAAY